jgi:hypothetical protein
MFRHVRGDHALEIALVLRYEMSRKLLSPIQFELHRGLEASKTQEIYDFRIGRDLGSVLNVF